jgi:hypothetical protein
MVVVRALSIVFLPVFVCIDGAEKGRFTKVGVSCWVSGARSRMLVPGVRCRSELTRFQALAAGCLFLAFSLAPGT